ncbi:MAG: ChaN family lipoprotein [Candidatus Binatia bacterium]
MMRLARAEFVLLGEKHDNPDHHWLQAEVLRGLIAAGPPSRRRFRDVQPRRRRRHRQPPGARAQRCRGPGSGGELANERLA